MIDAICFASTGIRDADGVYRDPFVPTPLTDAEYHRLSQRSRRIVAKDVFLDSVRHPRGGYPFNTLRNFARRLGLDVPGMDAVGRHPRDQREARARIADAILAHYGEAPAPVDQSGLGEPAEAIEALEVDHELALADALDADDYQAVVKHVAALGGKPPARDKESLYMYAIDLLGVAPAEED